MLGVTLLLGISTAFTLPAWQALLVEIVEKPDLPGAITLGSIGRIIRMSETSPRCSMIACVPTMICTSPDAIRSRASRRCSRKAHIPAFTKRSAIRSTCR